VEQGVSIRKGYKRNVPGGRNVQDSVNGGKKEGDIGKKGSGGKEGEKFVSERGRRTVGEKRKPQGLQEQCKNKKNSWEKGKKAGGGGEKVGVELTVPEEIFTAPPKSVRGKGGSKGKYALDWDNWGSAV